MSSHSDQQTLVTAGRSAQPTSALRKPRLGFLGVGWIGRHRLQAIAESGLADIVAIADGSSSAVAAAAEQAPAAERAETLDELLQHELDGVVIATPSAFHAAQSLAVLRRGIPVFCQKPLARTAAETKAVVDAARQNNCLLGVDLSYRFVRGVTEMRELIHSGVLGQVFAADLIFHNAYGPDKPWFYDPKLSGGGCVMDLGTHLVDLALWTLGFPEVTDISSQLFSRGARLSDTETQVEDYAVANLALTGDVSVRLACSWNLPAGCDAVIQTQFFGTNGAVALRNVNGSFYDFIVERYRGTARETISEPPDAWGGRAAVEWVRRLTDDAGYDPDTEHFVNVAVALDGIYQRCTY